MFFFLFNFPCLSLQRSRSFLVVVTHIQRVLRALLLATRCTIQPRSVFLIFIRARARASFFLYLLSRAPRTSFSASSSCLFCFLLLFCALFVLLLRRLSPSVLHFGLGIWVNGGGESCSSMTARERAREESVVPEKNSAPGERSRSAVCRRLWVVVVVAA